MEEKKYLKWYHKVGYGSGDVAGNCVYALLTAFMMIYLTDTVGLSMGVVSTLIAVSKIFDGVSDFFFGRMIDKTKTKMGKYRPWIIIGALSNAIVLSLLFTSFGMSGMKLYIYIAVMYVLWGMTNTMADIPYWSMVPSFTNDPQDRNLVATVARTFSGIGQGLISILTPIVLPLLSEGMVKTDKGYSADGFSKWAIICGILLVFFAVICVLSTKERHVVYNNEKFSFKKVFKVIAGNDQLVVFMIFAMISNAGWYLTSGTAVYYFNDVLGEPTAQSLFSTIGAVGSALGLLVIPLLSKKFSNRVIYQISLSIAILGYVLMYIFGPVLEITIALDLSYTIASIGIGSMFVAQTIFLADIVDYGEYKMGTRNESITFSMKGFLQKMAYTIQTIFLFGGLGLMNYNEQITTGPVNEATKSAIGIICFAVPPVLILISLIIFRTKFRIHGDLRTEIHDHISAKRASEKSE